jgi:uncharacterized FlaG/YvyC family protein
MRFEYDKEVNALYIYVREIADGAVARQIENSKRASTSTPTRRDARSVWSSSTSKTSASG